MQSFFFVEREIEKQVIFVYIWITWVYYTFNLYLE